MAPLHMEQLARGSCPGDALVTVYQAMHVLPETSGDETPYWLPPQEHAPLIAHADMIMGPKEIRRRSWHGNWRLLMELASRMGGQLVDSPGYALNCLGCRQTLLKQEHA